jgi:hypothetical protein
MQTLQVDKAAALKAFNKADDNGKALLKSLFGDQVSLQKITDRVTSYEDACSILDIDPEASIPQGFDQHVIAYCKLVVIAKALNEGWTPDWNDEDEYKYYPWFYLDKPGFRFYGTRYDCTDSDVGSRLCFKTRELANYAAQQFHDLYKDLFTL